MCDTLTQILKEKKYSRMFPQFTIYAEADITTHVKYRKHAPSLDISVKTHTAQFALPATRKFSHRWEIFFPVYVYSFSSVICCFAITLHTPHTVAYSNALEVLNDTLLRLHAGEEEGRRQQERRIWEFMNEKELSSVKCLSRLSSEQVHATTYRHERERRRCDVWWVSLDAPHLFSILEIHMWTRYVF